MRLRFSKGLLALVVFVLLVGPVVSCSKGAVRKWDLVNPEGVVKVQPMEVSSRPSTLEGKTVVLRGNGKHNSDNFLTRIAELLQKNMKQIKVIKTWEVIPETYRSSQNPDVSKEFAQKIAALKPDLVIASQAD